MLQESIYRGAPPNYIRSETDHVDVPKAQTNVPQLMETTMEIALLAFHTKN
jgi:hypothetical protein